MSDRILLIDRGREVLSGTLAEVRERVGAGRRLVLAVEGTPDRDALAACAGVARVDELEPGRAVLALDADGELNATLAAVSQVASIHGVHDERPTLHDIYLDAVQRRGEPVA